MGGEIDMKFKLGTKSKQRLQGVHPDLVAVVGLAIEKTDIDFTVLEGLRSKSRQRQLVDEGKSKTMNSRHLTGHAVDLAPIVNGQPSWDWKYYHQLAPFVKEAAEELGVELKWGGEWKSFPDGPHWQLKWHVYAADDMTPRADTQVIRPRPPAPLPPVQAPDPAPLADTVAPHAATEKLGGKVRGSIWQSKTIRSVLAITGLSGGNVVMIWEKLDDTEKMIVAGLTGLGMVCCAVIFGERLRKWIGGDR